MKVLQDSLTDADRGQLRKEVEFNLQVIYGGMAVLNFESKKPSEWKMTVPIFASGIMMAQHDYRSEHGKH